MHGRFAEMTCALGQHQGIRPNKGVNFIVRGMIRSGTTLHKGLGYNGVQLQVSPNIDYTLNSWMRKEGALPYSGNGILALLPN